MNKQDWTPEYTKWRHGWWYVNNIRYPSGAIVCVSNNYPDKKWRIVCDDRRISLGEPGDFTFPSRDAAAYAERDLAAAAFTQKTQWTGEDSVAASEQGWDIFESSGDVVELQLQRNDEMGIFASDDEAALFVKTRAAEGDPLAQKAIAHLLQSGSSDIERFSLLADESAPAPAMT